MKHIVSNQKGGLKILLRKNRDNRLITLMEDKLMWPCGLKSTMKSVIGKKICPREILFRDIVEVGDLIVDKEPEYIDYLGIYSDKELGFMVNTINKNYRFSTEINITDRNPDAPNDITITEFYNAFREYYNKSQYGTPPLYESLPPRYSQDGGVKKFQLYLSIKEKKLKRKLKRGFKQKYNKKTKKYKRRTRGKRSKKLNKSRKKKYKTKRKIYNQDGGLRLVLNINGRVTEIKLHHSYLSWERRPFRWGSFLRDTIMFSDIDTISELKKSRTPHKILNFTITKNNGDEYLISNDFKATDTNIIPTEITMRAFHKACVLLNIKNRTRRMQREEFILQRTRRRYEQNLENLDDVEYLRHIYPPEYER